MMDGFFVIFSRILEQLLEGFLFYGSNRPKVLGKLLCKGICFFNFSEQNNSTTDGFLTIFEMFRNAVLRNASGRLLLRISGRVVVR